MKTQKKHVVLTLLALIIAIIPTFGISNGLSSGATVSALRSPTSLAINEVMASNASTIADEDGDFEDWIEIHNYGSQAINLLGYGLSDSYSSLFKWVFPDVTIQAGQFMLIWASGKNRNNPALPLHTSYSISAAGEELILSTPEGMLVDEMLPIAMVTDISYGRYPDGQGDWHFFADPTPGMSNISVAYGEILSPPVFSHQGGFYETAFDLHISHPDPDVTIVYTLDGSDPDIGNLAGTSYFYKNNYSRNPGDPFGDFLSNSYTSVRYNDPVFIYDRTSEPDKLSQIATSYDAIPTYFPASQSRKGTVVRVRAYKPGCLPSAIKTHSYFVGLLPSDLAHLPIVSIAVQENYMYDYYDGIYVAGTVNDAWRVNNPLSGTNSSANWNRSGDLWEYPVNFELYVPGQATAAINQGVGFRIHGGGSRAHPTKSIRLYARNQYDDTSVMSHNIFHSQYNISQDLNSDQFRRLLLRSGGNLRCHLYDSVANRVMEPVFNGVQRGRLVREFVNGEYYGLKYIRDRQDEHHLANNFNVDPDNVIILDGVWGQGTTGHVDVGFPSDLLLYRNMFNYIVDNDMSDPTLYAQAESMLDIINYIDYNVMFIFFNNVDWYGYKHFKFWRVRSPSGVGFNDGKWRFMVWDFDEAGRIGREHRDLLECAIHPTGGGDFSPYNFGNNPQRTAMLRNLLENEGFKNLFINRFADHMNSTFIAERVQDVILSERADYEPSTYEGSPRQEHFLRWNRPAYSDSHLNGILAFSNLRPGYQRDHIRNNFGIASNLDVTVDVNNAEQGIVRINTINISPETPGVSDQPYPWTGVYFHNIPIEVEAKPYPGYTFSHWSGSNGSTEPIMTLIPTENVSLTAHFSEIQTTEPELMHYWHFNTLSGTAASISSDYSIVGSPTFTYPGTGAGYMDERTHRAADPVSNLNLQMEQQPNSGAVLRVRNPANTRALIIESPSTGFEDITVNFATTRTSNGASEQVFYYSTNGGTDWTILGEAYPVVELLNWALVSFDLSGVPAANNNPDLMFRIMFTGVNADISSGNNRIDNFSVHGFRLPEVNLPPLVIWEPILHNCIEEGTPILINLADVFTDPEADLLSYNALSSRSDIAQTQISGDVLSIYPIKRGDTQVTISANDGVNPEVNTQFRLLIHPKPHLMSENNYSFTRWDEDEAELSYPHNMLFLQSDTNDPSLSYPLLHPYYVEHTDYHADDAEAIGFPYKLSGRTRLNGMGDDGISFINTGRGRDLGGALLALNTSGMQNIWIQWLGGTVAENSRIYAIRLQYRIGTEGSFSDLMQDDTPVEYIRNTTGHQQMFSGIKLPSELEDQDYIQLLWKYYHVSGGSGARAQLRLDDILISGQLEVSPSEYTLILPPEASHNDEIIIRNLGSTTLNYTVTCQDQSRDAVLGSANARTNHGKSNPQVPWIQIIEPSGSIPPLSSLALEVVFDTIGLTSGSYLAAITVHHESGNDVVIPVSLTIAAEVAAPVFDPPGGTYLEPMQVSIGSSTYGASIEYSYDGVEWFYGDSVEVANSTMLYARATLENWLESPIVSAMYHMLFAPQEVTILVEDSTLVLSWERIPSADFYLVEAASDPTAAFVEISYDQGVFSEDGSRVSWSVDFDDLPAYRFFRVKAIRISERK